MPIVILLIVTLSGAGLAIETAANTRLGEALKSPLLAGVMSFLVGLVALLILHAAGLLGRGQLAAGREAPWWAWVGGLLGAFSVIMSILALHKAGAGGVVAATVFGQLLAGLLLDSFGWLGVERIPINGWRIFGSILLFAGALLVQKK